MDSPLIHSLSVCTGVGMLDVGTEIACRYLGYRLLPAAMCEWEAYAAATLLARMEESSLEPCPVWCGDLCDFDGRPFRGLVDIFIAGLPCQPYSYAGKQLGNTDQRSFGDDGSGPIPNALRIIEECCPAVVFLENVPAWIRGGWFRPVGEELCGMGFTLEEPLFVTAKSVGASHERERAFVMAHRAGLQRRAFQRSEPNRILSGMAYATGGRFRELWQPSRGDGFADGSDGAMGDTDFDGTRPLAASGGSRDSVSEPGGHVGNASEPACERDAGSVHRTKETSGGARSSNGCHAVGPESTGATLVDAPHSDSPRERQQRDDLPRPRSENLGDTGSDGSINERQSKKRQRKQQPGGAVESRRRRSAVADSECPGPQGAGHAEQARRGQPIPRDPDRGVFAPGPAANWGEIPEALWPAVEPGFRVLVDGMAVVLDASRSDALRCGGNGVVPVAAAVAFINLATRAGILTCREEH